MKAALEQQIKNMYTLFFYSIGINLSEKTSIKSSLSQNYVKKEK
tara:strand:- start:1 stop:132 length:132 start_codon:yes stop_codon:yes gene_type:complete